MLPPRISCLFEEVELQLLDFKNRYGIKIVPGRKKPPRYLIDFIFFMSRRKQSQSLSDSEERYVIGRLLSLPKVFVL